MNEYTPTTEDVRLVYMANCNRDCSVDHQAEFDRWLKSIQAEAWDEGVATGGQYGHEDNWDMENDPYRLNPFTPERWRDDE